METLQEREVLRLVGEALGLRADEREVFLERECGGRDALRAEVDAILAADVEQWTLGAPDGGAAIRDYVSRSVMQASPGEIIQGFTLLEEIGSGGMGVVYSAEQSNPRRTVALKLLHARLVGTDAAQRFAFEAETLARLRHPNIAGILQAGTYEIGDGVSVPWFAMELVEGALPITEACVENALDTEARLRLFADVCDAIHDGHQLGVIHRDLKPANVLVDGGGRVKVIDFSIATGHNRAETVTMLTKTGDLLGTLPYMSPEQVTGPSEGVDTRTDVYALGVLLFELLTGELPIEMSGLSLAESVRRIVESPSRRPGAVRAGLARELDWIVLKALEKDPARRYASASELRADVRRFLAGEAVQAGQPSVAYAAVKSVQRHPALASVVGLVLVGAVAFGVYQGGVAEREKASADEQRVLKEKAVAQEAKAHVLAARVASEQGQWQVAVDSLDQALALGVGDTVDVALDRVAAFVSLAEYEEALGALDALEDRDDVAAHAAQFLFYRGVVALADKDERDDGLPLLEMALRGSLPAADRAFASGMVAPTAPAAEAAFREAIALDSAHSMAWSELLNALVWSGQLGEAESMAEAMTFRFPRDRRIHAYRVLFAGLSGDAERYEEALELARPWMSPSELLQLPIMAGWMLDLDGTFGEMLATGQMSGSFLLRSLTVFLSNDVRDSMDDELLLGSLSSHQRFLVDTVESLASISSPMVLFRWREVADRLSTALEVNPNPLLRFARALAITFADDGDYESMAADYEAAAAELDFFPNIERFARSAEMQSRARVWDKSRGDATARELLECVLRLNREADLPAPTRKDMAIYASYADAEDVSRGILFRWERDFPDDLDALRTRVRIEREIGNWQAVCGALGRLLERVPEGARERAALVQQLKDARLALSAGSAAGQVGK